MLQKGIYEVTLPYDIVTTRVKELLGQVAKKPNEQSTMVAWRLYCLRLITDSQSMEMLSYVWGYEMLVAYMYCNGKSILNLTHAMRVRCQTWQTCLPATVKPKLQTPTRTNEEVAAIIDIWSNVDIQGQLDGMQRNKKSI